MNCILYYMYEQRSQSRFCNRCQMRIPHTHFNSAVNTFAYMLWIQIKLILFRIRTYNTHKFIIYNRRGIMPQMHVHPIKTAPQFGVIKFITLWMCTRYSVAPLTRFRSATRSVCLRHFPRLSNNKRKTCTTQIDIWRASFSGGMRRGFAQLKQPTKPPMRRVLFDRYWSHCMPQLLGRRSAFNYSNTNKSPQRHHRCHYPIWKICSYGVHNDHNICDDFLMNCLFF